MTILTTQSQTANSVRSNYTLAPLSKIRSHITHFSNVCFPYMLSIVLIIGKTKMYRSQSDYTCVRGNNLFLEVQHIEGTYVVSKKSVVFDNLGTCPI